MDDILPEVANQHQHGTFPFLDLPKDLRLMVYDCLLERTRQTSSVQCPQFKARVDTVFITADPIPPIHLACKFLSEEAGPFLKAKITRMSIPLTTPRIIVTASPIELYNGLGLTMKTLLDDIHRDLRVEKGTNCYVYSHIPVETLWQDDALAAYRCFEKNAASFAGHTARILTATNGNFVLKSWRQEVDYVLRRVPEKFAASYLTHTRDCKGLADHWASLPGGKDKGLHVAVTGNHEGFVMREFLEWLACWGIRIFVHAGEDSHGDIVFSDGWVRYEGVVSGKRWREEWM
jgi:hypothetical protein